MADLAAVTKLADEMQRANPEWRRGQAMFNALHELDPPTADRMRGTHWDPFYSDGQLDLFTAALSVALAAPGHDEPSSLTPDEGAVVARAATLLAELYDPAGVLIYWSSPIKSLGDRRPCDLWRDRDLVALTRMCDRLDSIADGNF